jgi:signal transduction histidine kinase
MKVRPKIVLCFSLIFVVAFVISSYLAHITIESSLLGSGLSDMQTASVLNEVGTLLGIAFGIIGIGAIITMFWVSSRITLPIKQLDSQLSSQDIGKKLRNIEIKRNRIDQDDEINEVIYTINSMISQINDLEAKEDERLAILTHELKTPLAAVLGFAQVMQKPKVMGELNPKQEKALKIINKNVTNLKVMIADLLDYHKLDLNKMRYEYAYIDIPKLLEKLLDTHQKYMEEKQIEYLTSTPGKIYTTTDRERLEHVFDHLILNAVDFVPQKRGKIEIGAQTKDGEILCYVKDNGIGIPVKKQEDLFKKPPPDRTITRKHGGRGIGLAVCKGIINGLGGKIWIESEHAKGSIFYFTIPIREKNEKID